ncbi:MAG: hypothetical protein IPM16_19760 [Chloroflexi bacterium]|nr:hypothetical protein [Chloroflexota bacterium]
MLRNLTISRTLTIILWLLLPVVGLRVQNDPDVWWQLRSGEQNLAAGRIVQADQFSYTFAGSEARLQHEWLAQPVLVAFWQTLGHVGLSLYAVLCGMLGMAVLYRTMHGGPYLKAFITVLGATSASIFWGARPLMLSFILAAVTLWLVYGSLRGRSVWRLWILPPMFVLWINLHGGWPQGALILMAAAAGMVVNLIVFRRVLPPRAAAALGIAQPATPDLRAELRKIALFLAPCIAAAALIPFLNPYGPQMLTVPIDTIGFDFQPIFIEEWRAPSLARVEMIPFFATVALTALAIALDSRRVNFVEVIMVAGASYMALTSARHIAFATSIAVIPLSIHVAHLGADRGIRIGRTTNVTPRRARLNAVLIAAIGFASVMYVTFTLTPVNLDKELRERLPIDAVEALNRIAPPQRLFNSWNFGGYLIYFAREYPVFIDGRADLYRAFTWEYIAIHRADPGWQDELAKWDVNSVLVEPETPLAGALRAEPGWSVAYEDDVAVLFVRG